MNSRYPRTKKTNPDVPHGRLRIPQIGCGADCTISGQAGSRLFNRAALPLDELAGFGLEWAPRCLLHRPTRALGVVPWSELSNIQCVVFLLHDKIQPGTESAWSGPSCVCIVASIRKRPFTTCPPCGTAVGWFGSSGTPSIFTPFVAPKSVTNKTWL
jgi:hypothetical protein